MVVHMMFSVPEVMDRVTFMLWRLGIWSFPFKF